MTDRVIGRTGLVEIAFLEPGYAFVSLRIAGHKKGAFFDVPDIDAAIELLQTAKRALEDTGFRESLPNEVSCPSCEDSKVFVCCQCRLDVAATTLPVVPSWGNAPHLVCKECLESE